jgi:hypothetical protein
MIRARSVPRSAAVVMSPAFSGCAPKVEASSPAAAVYRLMMSATAWVVSRGSLPVTGSGDVPGSRHRPKYGVLDYAGCIQPFPDQRHRPDEPTMRDGLFQPPALLVRLRPTHPDPQAFRILDEVGGVEGDELWPPEGSGEPERQ